MAIGFVLMSGGGSEDPNVFSDAIFNTQRLTIAPILILTGLVIEIFAILHKPKKTRWKVFGKPLYSELFKD